MCLDAKKQKKKKKKKERMIYLHVKKQQECTHEVFIRDWNK